MKKLFLALTALMIGAGFCSSYELLSNKTSELGGVISSYSDYLGSVLPINLGINFTDTEELVTLSIGLNGTEVNEGLINPTLTCRMTSEMMNSLINSGSVQGIKSALGNETIKCVSGETKGDVLASVLNGILGKKYVEIENQGILGQIAGAIAGFFGWIISLFN